MIQIDGKKYRHNLNYRRALKLIKPTFYMIIVITYMCWNLGLDKVALNY